MYRVIDGDNDDDDSTDGVEPAVYVVTSDKEDAIRKGLKMSQMQDSSIQTFCVLHAKWNVRDHVYVKRL